MSEDDPGQFSIAEAAVAMHEMFASLLAAGFTEDQALRIVMAQVRP